MVIAHVNLYICLGFARATKAALFAQLVFSTMDRLESFKN